jgi:hypothetical protein
MQRALFPNIMKEHMYDTKKLKTYKNSKITQKPPKLASFDKNNIQKHKRCPICSGSYVNSEHLIQDHLRSKTIRKRQKVYNLLYNEVPDILPPGVRGIGPAVVPPIPTPERPKLTIDEYERVKPFLALLDETVGNDPALNEELKSFLPDIWEPIYKGVQSVGDYLIGASPEHIQLREKRLANRFGPKYAKFVPAPWSNDFFKGFGSTIPEALVAASGAATSLPLAHYLHNTAGGKKGGLPSTTGTPSNNTPVVYQNPGKVLQPFNKKTMAVPYSNPFKLLPSGQIVRTKPPVTNSGANNDNWSTQTPFTTISKWLSSTLSDLF